MREDSQARTHPGPVAVATWAAARTAGATPATTAAPVAAPAPVAHWTPAAASRHPASGCGRGARAGTRAGGGGDTGAQRSEPGARGRGVEEWGSCAQQPRRAGGGRGGRVSRPADGRRLGGRGQQRARPQAPRAKPRTSAPCSSLPFWQPLASLFDRQRRDFSLEQVVLLRRESSWSRPCQRRHEPRDAYTQEAFGCRRWRSSWPSFRRTTGCASG